MSEEIPAPTSEEPAKPKKKLLQKTGAQVGDTVLYQQHDGEPHMAHVCKVWSPDCVNLDVVDGNGHHYTVTSAPRGTGAGTFRNRSDS